MHTLLNGITLVTKYFSCSFPLTGWKSVQRYPNVLLGEITVLKLLVYAAL